MNVGGVEMGVQEEAFSTIREDWNEYELASGVRVRLKLVVHKIARVLGSDGKPSFTDGDPHVAVRHQVQIVTSGGHPEAQSGEAH